MMQALSRVTTRRKGAGVKLFYGWVIVAAGIVVSCIGQGTVISLGVFLQPMSEAQGWSRAGISTAALLNFLGMGVGSFMWGALSDRYGTRVVVIIGAVLLGLGLLGASLATSLVQFQLAFGVVVGVASGSFFAPLTAEVTRWFTRNRSLAVALVSAGLGLGSTTVAPFASFLITAYDWRTAMFALGGLAWAVMIPTAVLVRRAPSVPKTAEAATMLHEGADHGLTVPQALRTPQFAAIALTFFCCCAAHSGPIFHMVTNAIDHGVPAVAAATVFSVAGLASFSGRIMCGLLADRVGARPTLIAGLGLQAMSISFYLFTRDLTSFYVAAAIFGLSYGSVMPLYAILVREYFGPRIMGSVFGAAALVSTLGMALGPWAGGTLYDTFGDYFWLYIGAAGIGLGAVTIAATFRPARLPMAVTVSPSGA
jgi:MFS family permease